MVKYFVDANIQIRVWFDDDGQDDLIDGPKIAGKE